MADIVIFEDNPTFASYIKDIALKTSKDFNIAFVVDNLEALRRYLELLEKPTIFLLDIMFGGKSEGFKIADIINQSAENSTIVFITEYPEKILSNSRYKLKALNTILKTSPNFEVELILTLTEAVQRLGDRNILIHSDKFTTVLVSIEGIFFIESIKGKGKIKIHHTKGIYEMRTTLNKIISQLPSHFVRCHNSYIVNTREIEKINHTKRSIQMNNNGTCYYSILNRKKLINATNTIHQPKSN